MSNHDYTGSLQSNAARKCAVVTPDPANDLPDFAVRGLWAGSAITGLVVDPIDGAPNITIGAIAAGTLLPLQVRRVRAATGTVIAFY
jgi:hypothetical protein